MSDLQRQAARMVGIGFGGTSLTQEAQSLIDRGVRNCILFAHNIESPSQLAELNHSIKTATPEPLMLSVDQEGGRVMRMREPFTLVPSMREVGQTNDVELAYELGQILARELRAVNFDMDLAPVLDVDTNPGNPVISSRSFGACSKLVSRLGVALIRGLQDGGVGACAKHFPGHGDTLKDSHHELPTLLMHDLERLLEVELPPFEAAVNAGVSAIMTAHVIYTLVDPVYPSTLSRTILDGLLRKHLGFQGLIVSDDMQMKAIADHFGFDDAIVRAANAGVNLFWICHTHELQHRAIDVLIRAVESGALPRSCVEESNRRMDAVFSRFVRPPQPIPQVTYIGSPRHLAVADEIKRRAGEVMVLEEDPTERFARQQQV